MTIILTPILVGGLALTAAFAFIKLHKQPNLTNGVLSLFVVGAMGLLSLIVPIVVLFMIYTMTEQV